MRSIRTRLIVVISMLVLLTVGVLGGGFYHRTAGSIRSEVYHALELLAVQGARVVELQLERDLTVMDQLLSKDLTLLEWEEKRAEIGSKINELGFFSIVYVVEDLEGFSLTGEVLDYSKDPLVQRALSGQIAVGRPAFSGGSERVAVPLVYPISPWDGSRASIIVYRDGHIFQDLVQGLGFGKKGYSFIVDSTGMTIAHPDSSWWETQTNVHNHPDLRDVSRALRNAPEVGVITYMLLGSRRMVGIAPIPYTDWSIGVGALEEDIFADFNRLQREFLYALIIVLGFALGAAVLLGNNYARPIMGVIECAKTLSASQSYVVIPREIAGRKDEIGALGRALELMTRRLSSMIDRLSQSENRYRTLVETGPDVVCRWRQDGSITYVNPEFIKLFCIQKPDLKLTWSDILGERGLEVVAHRIEGLNKNSLSFTSTMQYLKPDGKECFLEWIDSPIFGETYGIQEIQSVGRDISERVAAEESTRYLAYHDALTGLMNREAFALRVNEYLKKHQGGTHAVVFADLDHFKHINDLLGHTRGDEIIRMIASSLRRTLDGEQVLARFSGDEFVVFLPNCTENNLRRRLSALHRTVRRSLEEDTSHYSVTLSSGVAVYPEDDLELDGLISKASLALYKAKEEGRDRYQRYFPVLAQRRLERIQLRNDLARALRKEEFVVFYQPKLSVKTNALTGAEALVRWHHPELGLVSPVDFIPLAEETGLIVPLGEWVLRQACRDQKKWEALGYDPIMIAVNLSAVQLRQTHLSDVIQTVLTEERLDPSFLEVEITETVAIVDVEAAKSLISGMRSLGVSVAIDDFGAEYSSLNYLAKYSVDRLKIDRQLIWGLSANSPEIAVVRGICGIARELGMAVTAEGVEDETQLRLIDFIDEYQGYLFSPPVSAEDFVRFLKPKGPKEDVNILLC